MLSDRVIDLGKGQPEEVLLPWDIVGRSAAHRLQLSHSTSDPVAPTKEISKMLQYGSDRGDRVFRKLLAGFVFERAHGRPVREVTDEEANCFFITNGVSQALDMACTQFTKTGDPIFVEEQTYHLSFFA
jgi:2-aminoadipate transaminase